MSDAQPRRPASPRRTLTIAAVALFAGGAFVFAAARWLVPSGGPRDPSYAVSESATLLPDGTFRVTLDVSHLDYWLAFDLGAGQPSPEPERADLLVRRYTLRAPGGALALGDVALPEARLPDGPEWIADEHLEGDLRSPVLSHWYEYSYWTHRLDSKGLTYAVRRAGGGHAFLKIESYYCAPESKPGCLTLRYRLE